MFYLIDKPKGISSSQALRKFMFSNGISKAGHSGTLDPFATGLLIIASDEDTKFLSRFLEGKKTYRGKVLLGKRTTTLDPDGDVTEEFDDFDISFKQIEKVVGENFVGQIKQLPPDFSAKKINGKKAYELARENKEVKLKPLYKIVYDFKIQPTENPKEFSFIVTVSSGTYIRSLARDIGDFLNIPSMLIELERTHINDFSLDNSIPIDSDLEKVTKYSAYDMFGIETYVLDDKILKLILEGKKVKLEHLDTNQNEMIVTDKNETIKILVKKIIPKIYMIKKRLK